MAWIIFIVLLLFYFLGLTAFHAKGPIYILPYVAFIVLVLDRLLRLPRR